MSKSILLLHVPYGNLYKGINIKKLGWGVPPLGLAALSAYIKREVNCNVKLLDMSFQNVGLNDIPNLMNEFNPDIVGLSATTPQIENAYLIARAIRKYKSDTMVVLGGPHGTALPERTLQEEPCLDFIVMGEGEIPFLSLIKENSPESINGIAWRKEASIIVNKREKLIEDLGILPFPDYENLPLEFYGTFYSGNSVGIMSGRGCDYNCSFCASKVTHLGRYRLRPIGMFLNDIENLLALGVPRFEIWDDTFTASPLRVYEFLEAYQKRGFKAHWACETRVDCLNRDMIRAMHRAGLDIIHIGCESGNQDILRRTGKGIKLEQVKEAHRWCVEEGLTTYVYFMLGLPYDSIKTIHDTIRFAKKLSPDFVQFSMMVPLPGTRAWKLTEKGDVLHNLARSWSDYDRYRSAIVESDAISAQALTRLYKYALRSYYLRLSYLLRHLRKIRSFSDIKKYVRMGCSFIKLAMT